MKKFDLENMVKGWFVGNFKPSVYSSKDVEVAVKRYNKGDKEDTHHHRKTTEITVIIEGIVKMNGKIFKKNDILVINPFESTDFIVIEKTITVVVKIPGALNDKYKGNFSD
jgi:mannose-6-phosphate isomerase-like protein (cupin superfamily)